MTQQFVICDHGLWDANLIPDQLLGKPGSCPEGVYETWLIKGGNIVDWSDHWHRLVAGANYLQLSADGIAENINKTSIAELAARCGLLSCDCRLRVQLFHKPQPAAHTYLTYIAAVFPVTHSITVPFKITVGQWRRNAADVQYNYKLLGRQKPEAELEAAIANGCSDVVFLNNLDQVCEAVYANVWLYSKGKLVTPALAVPCLPGIMRKHIIATAKNLGIMVSEEDSVSVQCLLEADEVFLSSTVRGIQPVTHICDTAVGAPNGTKPSIATLLVESLKVS